MLQLVPDRFDDLRLHVVGAVFGPGVGEGAVKYAESRRWPGSEPRARAADRSPTGARRRRPCPPRPQSPSGPRRGSPPPHTPQQRPRAPRSRRHRGPGTRWQRARPAARWTRARAPNQLSRHWYADPIRPHRSRGTARARRAAVSSGRPRTGRLRRRSSRRRRREAPCDVRRGSGLAVELDDAQPAHDRRRDAQRPVRAQGAVQRRGLGHAARQESHAGAQPGHG